MEYLLVHKTVCHPSSGHQTNTSDSKVLSIIDYAQLLMDLYILVASLFGVYAIFILYEWLVQKLTVTISITGAKDDDRHFRLILKWLGKNIQDIRNFEYSKSSKWGHHKPSLLNRESSNRVRGYPSELDSSEDEAEPRPSHLSIMKDKYSKIPAVGTHYIRYRSCYIRLERHLPERIGGQEVLTFTTLSQNAEIVHGILEAAKPKPYHTIPKYRKHETTVLYPTAHLQGWTPLKLQTTKRPMETLALANNSGEKMLEDVKKFLSKEGWYFKRGIPWRKTYLLHGPPGCGKSSLIKAIAGEIGYGVCILPLTERLSDESFSKLLNDAPSRCIILLEDVDAAFRKGVNNSEEAIEDPSDNFVFLSRTSATLSISGFYNALDGVGAAEDGLLVFMTSNHPERLDRSLIRPGRVDYHVLLDYPNECQLEMMFHKFYPNADPKLWQRFSRVVRDCQDVGVKVSVAMIQGLLVMYSESPEDALENAEAFLRHKFNGNNNNNSSAFYS